MSRRDLEFATDGIGLVEGSMRLMIRAGDGMGMG